MPALFQRWKSKSFGKILLEFSKNTRLLKLYLNSRNRSPRHFTVVSPCPAFQTLTLFSGDDFVVQDWMTTWSQDSATPSSVIAPGTYTLNVQPYTDSLVPRVDLQNGRLYYFVVRLTNSMQQHALLSSDGTPLGICVCVLWFDCAS